MFNNRLFAPLVLLIAGCISVFAFAPFNKAFLIVISLMLLLWVINEHSKNLSPWKLIGLLYVYALAYFNVQLYWFFYSIHVIIHASVLVALISQIGGTVYVATYLVIGLYCYARFKTKSSVFNAVFLFPSFWVLFEWLRGWFLEGFPWCEVGYTQVDNVLFKGIYPILGNYAVSWLTVSLSGVLYLLLNHRLLPLTRSQLRVIMIYAMAVIMFGLSAKNIVYTQVYGKPLKISMLQGNIEESAKWSTHENLGVYTSLVKDASGDLILIPETAIAQFERDLPTGYLENLTKIAQAKKASLVVGMPKIIDKQDNYVNAAVLLTDPGHEYYAKYHLVPYGEYIPLKWLFGPLYKLVSLPMVSFTPGNLDQAPLVVANQKLAFNICYENGFNSELLKSASNSTIMVNLSDMVWYGTTIAKDEHLQISQARALENQRYFIQDTNTGLTAVIKPNGAIQSKLPSFKREILTDYVYGRVGVTPFERFGNYLIIALIILIIILGFMYNWINKLKSKSKPL